ncbi:MAG: Eco57I restriction-modification methylase domain-containing protein, partial [Chloroflexota bacterium]
MPFNIADARIDLRSFDLKKLFIEKMGWDLARQTFEIQVDGETIRLSMVAQKRGLAVLVCSPMADGSIPDSALRYKIEAQARKYSHEHLIVFTNHDKSVQKWQWVRREPGKPLARREYEFSNGQRGEALLQRLQMAVFELSEEDDLTIIEVGQRVKKAFDVEKVTKKFYDRFKKEHEDFLKFIKGIPDQDMQRWYVSVTLNRLMFVYFVQAKGFLDNNPKYLRQHLDESKKRGRDLFYSDFLCPLFFDGFAKKQHSAETRKLLGNIPYLNGGIFEKHQIEELHGEMIQIPDVAFEQLFDFFDEYRWHLDERPNKNDKEINPDVLGYIFEKYINQKQMGAYYTKEDITEYISKNTIIPHLFDVAQKECKVAFEGEGSVWRHLQADPDRYIYAAVRKGVDKALPAETAAGESDPKRREGWNKPAPEEFALPTEIWREVIARRRRYQEVKEKLSKGEVASINDLITLNLDIRQFAQDVIQDSDADLLLAFWKALTQIKILDPTVGSGAFLFAALNVLEPLYEACVERMSALVEELDRSGGQEQERPKHSPKKYEPFRKVLEQVRQRPDEDYFIFKSIIINNLYGVDIMEEAVEICKLRLFLKLASQVEPDASRENLGIEPLPDIDFNIRAGNTLVGFATREDVKRSVQFGTVGGVQSEKLFAMPEEDAQLKRIEEKAEDVDRLYKLFRQQQTEFGGEVRPEDKRELQKRLGELEKELNVLLAKQYGISLTPHPSPTGRGEGGEGAYKKWLESHTPFHWFVEFFGIMNEGGFDVIIGNPPYVEYSKVKDDYKILNYRTEECGNLYAFIVERNKSLLAKSGRSGMIIPHSAFCTDRMKPIIDLFKKGTSWVSTYDIRPAKLFVGVDQRLAIYIHHATSEKEIFSTKYHRWNEEARAYLFEQISYAQVDDFEYPNSFAKIGKEIERELWQKIHSNKPLRDYLFGNAKLYFHNAPRYWVRAMTFTPYFWNKRDGEKLSTQVKELSVTEKTDAKVLTAALNSSLYYWWFLILSDSRHLNLREIENFPISLSKITPKLKDELAEICERLMKDFKKNSVRKDTEYQTTGRVIYDEYYPRLSKPIIDEIDRALARHYGLSDE